LSQKPWRQLAFILGEAGLSLLSGGVLFIEISRLAGPVLLGIYALAFAWLLLFQGVGSFGIPEFIMREVGAHGGDAGAEVGRAMLLGLGSALVSLCLMLIIPRCLGYPPQVVQAIALASLAVIPAFINTACRAVFLAMRRMHVTFLALLVEVAIIMSASPYFILTSHGAISLMGTLVVAKIASATVALATLHCRILPLRTRLDLRLLMRTARRVFTFGVGFMLGVLTMRLNTIMASVWVDIAVVGHYAAATKVMELCLIIPNLISQLLMTRMAYSFATQVNLDPNRFAAWFRLLFALVIPACVGVWVFAGTILALLFGPGFAEAAWVLRILMLYVLIEATDAKMSIILKASHRQRQDLARLAFNPLINIALNLLLLPVLGITGAAIGRVGGVVVSATLRHRLIARELTGVRWLQFAMKPLAISLGVGAVCCCLSGIYRPIWLMPIYLVTTGLLLHVASGISPATIKDMMSIPSPQE
jgi:O-antigen/teichoic acid export membrane protein